MNSAEKILEFEEVRQRYAELRREQKKTDPGVFAFQRI